MPADSTTNGFGGSPEPPERAWLLGLLSLPGVGPRRLQELLVTGRPREAWDSLLAGGTALPLTQDRRVELQQAAAAIDIAQLWTTHTGGDVQVLTPDDEAWPRRLRDDPEPPAILIARGDLSACAGPSVAIVGTRRCTAYGRSIATQLGRELTAAGVSVVSGLALGIDAAAHAGALEQPPTAPPIAVLAGGLDRPAPQANAGLFARIATQGLVLTETPIGTAPQRWRFPARNRIVAALADVVVVVESAATGGSMYTVDEALRRDRLVFAVPGSIHSPVSIGTNRLIADGALPVVEIADVLTAFGLTAGPAGSGGAAPELSADATRMLDLIGFEPELIDELITVSGLTVGRALRAVDELLRAGVIARSGATVQRLGRPDPESS